MVTSMSRPTRHFQRLPNGRKFSFHVDSEDMPAAGSFVHLAKTASRSEDHLKHLVSKSVQGLRSGYSPTLCESGVGGTYFMHDEDNRTIGVFKPHDEEMWCMNNPKGFTPKTPSFKEYNATNTRGAEAGEAAFREYAAYLLDHDNFSGVPATGLVVCSHPTFSSSAVEFNDQFKIGSFQEFKEHDFDAEDISSGKYQMFPVHEVHKIAILDIRLLNTDRHGGNILVKANRSRANSKEDVLSDSDSSDDDFPRNNRSRREDVDESELMFRMDMDVEEDDDEVCYSTPISSPISVEYELIPIDHGYTLPSTLSGLNDLWFEWLKWPQAKVTFGPEAQRYIDHLDPEADVSILRNKFGDLIGSECFKVLRITTTWLKIASRAGLTPYTIGNVLCRKNPGVPSALEKMCMEAQALADKQLAEESPHTPHNTPHNTPSNTPVKQLTHPTSLVDLPTKMRGRMGEREENGAESESSESESEGATPDLVVMSHPEQVFLEKLRAVMLRSASDLLRSQAPPSRPYTPSPLRK